jgi:hypothetical protein
VAARRVFALRAPAADTPVKSLFALPGSVPVDSYGVNMRRHLVLAAALTGVLAVSACASDTGTRRTVTAVVTVSSGAEAGGSAAPSGSGEAPSSGSAEASASASPEASPSPSAAPIVTGVDPLKVDCGAIISAADVKKIFDADIPNDRLKVNVAEVNTDVGQTGSVRCLYGLSEDKKSGQFTLRLTNYSDPASAQKQVEVTVQNETDNGANITPTTVDGYPATVALREGGLIIMPYDTWTLAIAAPASIDDATLTTGLPQLAEAALARIIKS